MCYKSSVKWNNVLSFWVWSEPNGELAKYLEGLAEAEDVQSYVKENAFGQPPVNSSHPDWGFYSKVLNAMKIKQQNWLKCFLFTQENGANLKLFANKLYSVC